MFGPSHDHFDNQPDYTYNMLFFDRQLKGDLSGFSLSDSELLLDTAIRGESDSIPFQTSAGPAQPPACS